MSEQREILSDTLFADPVIPLEIHLAQQADLSHHMHTFIELVMVVEGSGTHIFKSERYPITVGDVFIIPPYTPHGYADTDRLAIYNILFKGRLLERFRTDLELVPGFHGLVTLEPYYRSVRGFSGRLILTPEQISQATSLVARLQHERNSDYDGRSIMVENLFIELLLFYCRRFSEDAGPLTRVMPVARTIGHMNIHFDEALSLEQLVETSKVSKRSLIRHFKNTTGVSPMHYLQKVRITKARELLKTQDRSITQIAMDTGFNDAAYFSLVFRKHTGMTPSAYRRNGPHEETTGAPIPATDRGSA
ncbi:MAG: helix-turn-helix domain-containing protein [Anaerolineae bacterium]|nr:helix-turn-helix domain-containing protein [Anaerolineae bacterium]